MKVMVISRKGHRTRVGHHLVHGLGDVLRSGARGRHRPDQQLRGLLLGDVRVGRQGLLKIKYG